VRVRKTLSNLKRQSVTKYLEDIRVSTEYPNKKDAKDGKSLFILKKSLKETYDAYKSSDEYIGMSFSTFATMVPKHVKKVGSAKWRQCLCTSCENFRLIIVMIRVSLFKEKRPIPVVLASHSILCQATICSPAKWECYDRTCRRCCDKMDSTLSILGNCSSSSS
jgi:hypothetical protein